MAIHWQIKFKDRTGKLYTVSIYDSAYTGEPVQLLGASKPLSTSESTDVMPYLAVRKQSGYIRFIVEDAKVVTDIMPVKGVDRPIVVTSGDKNVWCGFLSGESYSQPWKAVPYEIELPVVGILDTNVGAYFPKTDGYASLESLVAIVAAFFPAGMVTAEYADNIDATVCVPNSNFQTLLSEQERRDSGTDDIYSVPSVSEVISDFCEYFGCSCRQSGTKLIFYTHDAKEYTTITPAVHRMSDLTIRSASNTVSYTKPSGTVRGTFDTGADAAETPVIEMPSKFSEEFAINKIYGDYVFWKDNERIQEYIEGVRSYDLGEVADDDSSRSLFVYLKNKKSYGQLLSYASIEKDSVDFADYKPSYVFASQAINGQSISWQSGINVMSTKGEAAVTAAKIIPVKQLYIPKEGAAMFNISAETVSVMPYYSTRSVTGEPADGDGYNPRVHNIQAKVKVGKYYLKLSNNGHFFGFACWGDERYLSGIGRSCEYEWTEEETICPLVMLNDKICFAYIKQPSESTSGSYGGSRPYTPDVAQPSNIQRFDKTEGICIYYPEDIRGTLQPVSVEIMANSYEDWMYMYLTHKYIPNFKDYQDKTYSEMESAGALLHYINYVLKSLTVKTIYLTDTASMVSSDTDTNKYLVKEQNDYTAATEVTAPITTRQGLQHGTGIALSATHAIISTQYDKLGVQRRAKFLDRPRDVIKVSVAEVPEITDTISWNGNDYIILARSIDWRNATTELTLMKTEHKDGVVPHTVLPADTWMQFPTSFVYFKIGKDTLYCPARGTVSLHLSAEQYKAGINDALLETIDNWRIEVPWLAYYTNDDGNKSNPPVLANALGTVQFGIEEFIRAGVGRMKSDGIIIEYSAAGKTTFTGGTYRNAAGIIHIEQIDKAAVTDDTEKTTTEETK